MAATSAAPHAEHRSHQSTVLAEPIANACLLGRELLPPRAALLDHLDEQIVGQFNALVVQSFFNVQQAAANERVDRLRRRAALNQLLAPRSTLIDSR